VGSFNNELGLPLTLLECDERTRFCILEMGARHKGDLTRLCQIAKPDIGIVLAVGTAHFAEFGSQGAIAETKAELIQSLGGKGVAILGTYDEFTPAMAALHKGVVLTFGEKNEVDVRAADIEIREGRPHFDLVTKAGRDAVGMRVVGAHQVANALAVAAVGTALALPIELIASSLSTAEISSKWRMELHDVDDLLIINDSYNANPASMAAALNSLCLFAQARGGQSWAFIGKMHELGESGASASADIGTLASVIGIDHLVVVNAPEYGSGVGPMQIHHVANINVAAAFVEHVSPGDVILVKASRAERFELLADDIKARWIHRNGVEQ
jgi:UDP-N-acetylmuramoyl-tripeptide--D-alanyl-D-alanine ligase